MYKLNFFIALIFICPSALGQIEILMPYEDTTKSITNATHFVDKAGSTYLLSNIYSFYAGSGVLIEGNFTYGTNILKLDKGGNRVWSKFYPTSYTSGNADQNASGRLPAWQLYDIADSTLFVPYNIYLGYRACESINSISGTSRNGGLLINKSTGETIQNVILDEDTLCGMHYLNFSAPAANGFTYIYYHNRTHQLFKTQRTSSFTAFSTVA